MDLLQPREVSKGPFLSELNYGLLQVPLQPDSQTAFTGYIKDVHGQALDEYSLSHSDISFNETNTRFPKVCEARWADQHTFRMLLHLSSEALVWPWDAFAYRRLFVCAMPTVSLAVAGLVRLTRLLVGRQ